MGQKSNPISLRLKINRDWESSWYSDKSYGDNLIEDIRIRELIKKRVFRSRNYSRVEISNINIKRFPNSVDIYIFSSRPGFLIGKKGADIDQLRKAIQKQIGIKQNVNINVNEIKKVDLDGNSLAQMLGKMIEGRRSYKKAMKQTISRAMSAGAKGIKLMVSGRLGGSDMARRESFREGSIPLQTFDAVVSYGRYDALTTYGIIGVTVWVYVGRKSKRDYRRTQIGKLVSV